MCPVGESSERLFDDPKEGLQRPEVLEVRDRGHCATSSGQADAVRFAKPSSPILAAYRRRSAAGGLLVERDGHDGPNGARKATFPNTAYMIADAEWKPLAHG